MMSSTAFYPTQVQISPDKSSLQKNINKFHKLLNYQLNQGIILKKHELIKKSKQLNADLQKIKEQTQKYRNKIYQQEKLFQENVQNHIKYDVKKWKDYDMYFRNHFKIIENNVHHHRKQNQIYKQKIKEKTLLLKLMLKQQIKQMVLQPKAQSSRKTQNLTTIQSTIKLSYSKSIRERIKTQSSLPSLKPYNKNQRFKTIQSDNDDQYVLKQKRKANSYMQSIGTFKEKQTSLFPLLINMFCWYKDTDVDYQNNWFAKVILKSRNFNKLIHYLQKKSITRKVIRKK